MSEVDRFTRQGVGASDRAGFWVHAGDFNQKMSQAKDREAYLQDQIEKWTALSGEHFKRAEIMKLERDALQQRLTAADERADVLEAQLSKLSAIGSLIRSQDNRCTDQPMFAVMEKRSLPTLDTHDHDRIDWVDTETGDYCLADETKARRLEALHQGHRETPGWERYAMKDIDVFVTACFTEQGCKEFLARDGHNHRSPFIYAFGSYRNGEYQAVRDYLKGLQEPVK